MRSEEGRYHRQTLLPWWDQRMVAQARVLVVGAGALGNEILKCLALMGVGQVLVYDMDRIERSNLSRSVLFREEDEGCLKAEVAARRMRELNREVTAVARPENLALRGGLGVFLWADVVLCAVDNREARIFINSACSRMGRVWVDGALEGLSGVVRAFHPSEGACYECTMNETDRRLVAERRSCALLARQAAALGHVPSTAVSASVVGALEVQEAIKFLHGQPYLKGEGLHLDGLHGDVHRVAYPRREGCPGHDRLPRAVPLGISSREATLQDLLERAERILGDGACLDLSRDLVTSLACPRCGRGEPGGVALGEVTEARARCPHCGSHRVVETASSVSREAGLDLSRTPVETGLPPFDVVVARQGLEKAEAWLFDGDASGVLGPLAEAFELQPRARKGSPDGPP